ncbi:unnamed protein product, partial [Meganyctiphanes norvegica]
TDNNEGNEDNNQGGDNDNNSVISVSVVPSAVTPTFTGNIFDNRGIVEVPLRLIPTGYTTPQFKDVNVVSVTNIGSFIPPGIQVIYGEDGTSLSVQIPKSMTWKDVRNSNFPDNKSRKLWRDVFRTLSGLSEDDDKKKDVDDEKTQILVDAVQDFQLPPNLSL